MTGSAHKTQALFGATDDPSMNKRWFPIVLMMLTARLMPGGPLAIAADKPRNAAPPVSGGQVVALVEGQSVTWDMLKPGMIEAAGGQTLSEWILDRKIDAALKFKGLAIGAEDIAREKALLISQVSGDPDIATRLLEQLKEDRGLGAVRFDQLLRRTAGMRKLVASEVNVTEPMIRQIYEERHGPKTEVRMILSPTLPESSKLMTRAQSGESFIDLAIANSKDESRNQGGLLPPISVHDSTFPKALRDSADKLKAGEISNPIALPGGFALLKCERKIPGGAIAYQAIAEQLKTEVRLRQERALMSRQARTLMENVDVTVLDSDLNEAWKRQKRLIKEQNPDSK